MTKSVLNYLYTSYDKCSILEDSYIKQLNDLFKYLNIAKPNQLDDKQLLKLFTQKLDENKDSEMHIKVRNICKMMDDDHLQRERYRAILSDMLRIKY